MLFRSSLLGNTQTGEYDKGRLISMVKVAKHHGLLSKEHNGDYIQSSVIKQKFSFGLDAINIAPEFGLIETNTYLNEIRNTDMFDKFWKICFESDRWKKWVDEKFNPYEQKEELIKICGHYVLSTDEFYNDVKINLPNIDNLIIKNIKIKLNDLYE